MRNICIVGCGKIGRLHSKNLANSANLTFYSRSIESAQRLNRRFNGRGVFNSYDEVLASPGLDALVICSPPERHANQVVPALEAGKSVLVEKPLCISEVELDLIDSVVPESPESPFLMVAENYYYKPSVEIIRRILAMGRLGSVQRVDVKKVFRRSSKGWRSQYGALLEGGIHFVALISDIFNDSPIKVSAHFPRQGKGEVERSSIVEMVYGSGATARLSYSWETSALAMGAFQHSTITGDRGVVIFESNGLYVWLKSQGLTKLYFPQLTDLLGYKSMIHDFLSCLEQDGRMPYSNITRARRDLGIVFLAYRQLEKSGNS